MNAIEKAVARLSATVQRAAGLAVQYYQDGLLIELTAVMADVDAEVVGPDGFPVVARATDFLIPCAELLVGGEPVEPKAGDQVRVQRGGKLETYEAMRLGGDSHFEPADPYSNQWRVHTKRVSVQ